MAESIVQLNTGSGGPKLHTFNRTIGANSVEDEVVLLGEQYLATYTFEAAAAINANTANSHMIQIMAGASLNVYLRWMRLYAKVLAGAATSIEFQIRRLSTAGTGGTAGSVLAPYNSTDAAIGATAMILPTVKGTEGVQLHSVTGLVPAALPATPGELKIFDVDFDKFRTGAPRVPAGVANGLCLKNIQALATATYTLVFAVTEANF